MPARGQTRPLIDRWRDKVAVDADGCWRWTGYVNGQGYGTLNTRSRGRVEASSTLAHRIGYELLRGPIPDGLGLDHLCNNRTCVNPEHLEPVTNDENSHRSKDRRSHCHRGHAFVEGNIRWECRTFGVVRVCLSCRRQQQARRRAH